MRHVTIRYSATAGLAMCLCALSLILSAQLQPILAQNATPPPTQSAQPTGVDTDGLQPITLANASRIAPLTRLGQLGRGNTGGIAWSPDGSTLAVSSDVGIWLYASARLDDEPRLISTIPDALGEIVYSPDGKLLATTDTNGLESHKSPVRIWDVQAGKSVATFQYQEQDAYSVAFSNDGKLVVVGTWDGTVQFWDLQTKQLLTVLK